MGGKHGCCPSPPLRGAHGPSGSASYAQAPVALRQRIVTDLQAIDETEALLRSAGEARIHGFLGHDDAGTSEQERRLT